jgi:hypothetical protein
MIMWIFFQAFIAKILAQFPVTSKTI